MKKAISESKSKCRQQTVVTVLASPSAFRPAFYFTIFINHDDGMIVNLSDAISVSGCNLRLDE